MATPIIGMTKPTSGDTGWGTVINANLDLIDTAFTGISNTAITMSDAAGVRTFSTGATNGTKIGATGDKLAFYGGTPITRPAHADQAAAAAQTQQDLTDSSGGTASTTLASISDTATKNAVASLAARLAEVKADVAAVRVLTNRLRTDLAALVLIKGSA
jgi:hypothetical protein